MRQRRTSRVRIGAIGAAAALVASLLAVVASVGTASAAPADIVVSGDAGTARWLWGGNDYDQLQGLLDTENFGEANFIVDADGMDPAALDASVHVFVAGATTYSEAQETAIVAWIRQGGVYIANTHAPFLDNVSFLPGAPAFALNDPVAQWQAEDSDPDTHSCQQNDPATLTCESGAWTEFSAPVTATIAAPTSPLIAGPHGTATGIRPWHTVATFASMPTDAEVILNFTNTCSAATAACAGMADFAYNNTQNGALMAIVPFGKNTALYGSGAVVAMSDGDLFSNAYGTDFVDRAGTPGSNMIAGNRALALNTFAWIGDHFTADAPPPGGGGGGGGGGFPPGICRTPSNPASNPDPASADGYWFLGADGGVFSFGNVNFLGSLPGIGVNTTAVAMAATPDGSGYWAVDTAGNIYPFGSAQNHGDMRNTRLNSPIIGIESSATGNGYWLLAGDGGVFSFGDATFHGSTGNIRLNQPIIGMRATISGGGYWLLAADGGVFSFGDAVFHGSTGSMRLNAPVISMAVDPNGAGYWLLGRDGGVFSFGVDFQGSVPGLGLCANPTAVQIRATGTGEGYYLLGTDGGVFSFGDAQFKGSLPQIGITPNRPLIDMLVQY